MLFNSSDFGIFLIIALILFWSAPQRHRVFVLLGLSYYFYMYYYPMYVFLLAVLTLFNYAMAVEMVKRPRFAKLFLVVAIALDLLSIGFYKYAEFAVDSLESVAGMFGTRIDIGLSEIVLPLGISFFTFQMMSYIVDVYRGERVETSFWNFAAYVSFFPQLVAGPIVRPGTLLPQLKSRRVYNDDEAVRGIFLIVQGLVKKIAFADFLGGYVDKMFAAPDEFTGLASLVGIYAYAFQIYFDFSGYTDIAIGCGKLFGFTIPINFNLPYISKSPREFWRRWHISLSTWLRDYLYIPLGGNRKGEGRTHVNMMITMVLGGLWHGANWTFVLWGAYHGVLVSAQRFLEERFPFVRKIISSDSPLSFALSACVTFHLVCLGWILFRAHSVSEAATVLGNVFVGNLALPSTGIPILIMLGVAALSHIVRRSWDLEDWYVRLPAPVQAFGYVWATALIYLFFTTEERFIYFQF
ncbi:MAG: MBOAT family protein [Candidatus Abyssubacteria bacterium]